MALAERVIASHYAEAVERKVAHHTPLRCAPSVDAELIRELTPGEAFAMLDERLGWAWGYAGEELRVGYVEAAALG